MILNYPFVAPSKELYPFAQYSDKSSFNFIFNNSYTEDNINDELCFKSGGSGWVNFITKNAVDLTNWNTMTFIGRNEGYYDSGVAIWRDSAGSSSVTYKSLATYNTQNETVTIDVSSYTGVYYLGAYAHSSNTYVNTIKLS